MGTADAHTTLGVTLRTLYKLIDEGSLPAFKFGRVVRIRRSDLDDFIDRCRIKPGELGHLSRPGRDDDDFRQA